MLTDRFGTPIETGSLLSRLDPTRPSEAIVTSVTADYFWVSEPGATPFDYQAYTDNTDWVVSASGEDQFQAGTLA
jgi:hypothetical protein